MTERILCSNRKAKFDYEILESIEAGISLRGSEVKSILQAKCSLEGAYIAIVKNEAFLIGCNVEKYKQSGDLNHEPLRDRKLLLHKSEIKKFADIVKAKGFTLIPLSFYYSSKHKIKIRLAICKGKQTQDKRQYIKERDAKRQIKTNLY